MGKKVTIETSLAAINPSLATEWHPTLNKGLSPYDVFPNSNKKAWWLGKCGHSWEAVIASRNKGFGCPICAGLKVLDGFNDLRTTHPDLAKEWHPYLNGELLPENVIAGSGKKVWWLCSKCGYEWQAVISNRKQGNDCPNCKSDKLSTKAKHQHISKNGSLAERRPDLAAEWHPTKNGCMTPNDYTARSDKKAWWLGKCGHEWQAMISNREKGTGCPYCKNQKALDGYNDLSSHYPDLAKEWHPTKNGSLKPTQVVFNSNKNVWWLGKCGHEWQQKISNRTSRSQGCPICGKKAQTSFPEQAIFYYIRMAFEDAINGYQDVFNNEMEIDIYIPSLKFGIEYDGIQWHNDEKSLKKEEEKYKICKEHGIKLLRVKEELSVMPEGISDYALLVKRHPKNDELDEILLEISTLLGVEIDIDTRRDSLAIKAQYISSQEDRSLAVVNPELAKEWNYEKNHGLSPTMFLPRSGAKVWWKCPICDYEWQTRIASRSAGSGCPKCMLIKRGRTHTQNMIAQKGSLKDNNPILAREWHPILNVDLKPEDVLATSTTKVWWKCSSCSYEWQADIRTRHLGSQCPICRKQRHLGKTKQNS